MDQIRSYNKMSGTVSDDTKYKYTTCTILAEGTKERDATGEVKLTHTYAQLDLYDKDKASWIAAMDKINKVKAAASNFLNISISDSSIALLKSKGADLYSDALCDPVNMLILIDQTHQLSDDANQVKALADLMTCSRKILMDTSHSLLS